MATLWLLLPRLFLLISVSLLVLADPPTTHTSCNPATKNNTTFDWWYNKKHQNPCEVLQNLLRQCDPDHTIHAMPESPLSAPDICTSPNDASTAAKVSPCCCNTAAYALRQACWSCQHGEPNPSSPHRRPTFREYLQCPESARNRSIFKAAKVPKWAFLPIEIDAPWSFAFAMVASRSKYKVFMNMDPDDHDDDNHDGHGGKGKKDDGDSSKQAVKTTGTPTPSSGMSHTMMAIAIAGGVLAGLAAVACALAVAICLQRRRQKRRDAAEAASPPSWYTRGNYIPNHVRGSQSTFDLEGPPMAVVVSRPTLTIGSTASRRAASWNSSLAREPTMNHSSGTGERTMVQSTVYGYGTLKPQRLSSTDTHSFSI